MTAVWASRHEALVSHAVVSRFRQIAWWRASILRVVSLDLAGNSTAPKPGRSISRCDTRFGPDSICALVREPASRGLPAPQCTPTHAWTRMIVSQSVACW